MSEGEASICPFKRRRSRKKTAICKDDDKVAPGIIIQHVVQHGRKMKFIQWLRFCGSPINLSQWIVALWWDCLNFQEIESLEVEDMLQFEEVDAFSKAGQGLPKVFKVNIAQFISYWVRFSNLSISKNL